MRLAAGGRPRGRIGPVQLGAGVGEGTAEEEFDWALVLRSSSLAHLAQGVVDGGVEPQATE